MKKIISAKTLTLVGLAESFAIAIVRFQAGSSRFAAHSADHVVLTRRSHGTEGR